MKQYLLLNGPNINMTGLRETGVYGKKTYEDLVSGMLDDAARSGCSLRVVQSNSEGALIDAIQQAYFDGLDGIIFNPGGYTHTSVALHDVIASVPIPTIEVHMSNIHAREEVRHHSMTASACRGQIVGLGFLGYHLALQALIQTGDDKA